MTDESPSEFCERVQARIKFDNEESSKHGSEWLEELAAEALGDLSAAISIIRSLVAEKAELETQLAQKYPIDSVDIDGMREFLDLADNANLGATARTVHAFVERVEELKSENAKLEADAAAAREAVRSDYIHATRKGSSDWFCEHCGEINQHKSDCGIAAMLDSTAGASLLARLAKLEEFRVKACEAMEDAHLSGVGCLDGHRYPLRKATVTNLAAALALGREIENNQGGGE